MIIDKFHRLGIAFLALITIATAAAQAPTGGEPDAGSSNGLPPRPLTLSAALAYAAEHNPGLRQVREQIREQEGVLIQVKALRQPGLGMHAHYGDTRDQLMQIPGYVSEYWQVKMTASKVLYAGGGIRAGIRAQSEQVEIARLTYAAQEQNVLMAVRECFYGVLLSRELINVREEAVAVLETVLTNARHRQSAGVGSRFEVIRAEATLANAQPSLIQARNDYRVAQDRLCRLIGLAASGDERAELGLLGDFPQTDTPPPLGAALKAASEQRVELERQKHIITATEHGISATRAGNLPTVAAQIGYEYAGDYTSSRIRNSIPGWSAGVQTDWAIFDGRARAGKIAQARSRHRQARITGEDLEIGIDLEVRESHAALGEARQLLVAAAKTVAEASESLRLAKASEQEGMATQLDVITAQAALTEARSVLSNARFRCAVADARLNRAMGQPATAQ